MIMITGRQIAAGRVLSKLKQSDLAGMAGVSRATLNNVENGADAKASTLNKIAAALQGVGVEFVDTGSREGATVKRGDGK